MQTIGTCQCCFRKFVAKSRTGSNEPRLVLHGYERPGHGYLQGKCRGENELPFELSCELAKTFHKQLVEVILPGLKEGLQKYQSGVANLFAIRVRQKLVFVTEGEPLPLEVNKVDFKALRADKIFDLEQGIAQVERDVRYLARKITDWKPTTLETRKEADLSQTPKGWFKAHQEEFKSLPAPEGEGSFSAWASKFPQLRMWGHYRAGGTWVWSPKYYQTVREAYEKAAKK